MGTHKLSEVTQAVKDKLEANKNNLGLQDIYWGDQDNIPRYPAACVEPGDLERVLDGTLRAQNNFQVFVLVYLGRVGDIQEARKAVLKKVEDVQDILESDVQMNDTVVFGHVTQVTPGYAQKGNVLLHAARLTWVALTRHTIGVN